MMRLGFYGYSDDVAYCVIEQDDGKIRHKDIGCFERTATFKIIDPAGGKFNVSMFYSPDYSGTWTIGIGMADEGVPLPVWAERPVIQIMDDEEGCYTPYLRFKNVPNDVEVLTGEEECLM